MALRLYPPRARGGKNKFWVIRGMVNGKLIERSTKAKHKAEARRQLDAMAEDLAAQGLDGRGTFAGAARRYVEFRHPSRMDQKRIDVIVAKIGKRPVRKIIPADLHDVANELGAGCAAATRNRNYLRPAITVMHHAARAGLCDWMRVEKFPEASPETRVLTREQTDALIGATQPWTDKRLLLLWLFGQGTRITRTLNVTWEEITLLTVVPRDGPPFVKGNVRHIERKGRREHRRTFALHDEVIVALLAFPPEARTGFVFPWRNRRLKWLQELAAEVGVKFSPHMARHTLATRLNEEGVPLKTIMATLGHADERSSLRYQHPDLEVVRAALAKIRLTPARPFPTSEL